VVIATTKWSGVSESETCHKKRGRCPSEECRGGDLFLVLTASCLFFLIPRFRRSLKLLPPAPCIRRKYIPINPDQVADGECERAFVNVFSSSMDDDKAVICCEADHPATLTGMCPNDVRSIIPSSASFEEKLLLLILDDALTIFPPLF